MDVRNVAGDVFGGCTQSVDVRNVARDVFGESSHLGPVQEVASVGKLAVENAVATVSNSTWSGGQRQTVDCNGNDNVLNAFNHNSNVGGVIVNPLGGSPAQIWHVGVRHSSDLKLVSNCLVKGCVWPFSKECCTEVGKSIFRGSHTSCVPHVLFVRGCKLNHNEKDC